MDGVKPAPTQAARILVVHRANHAPRNQHERVAGQLGERDRAPARKRVVPRQHGNEGLLEEAAAHQVRWHDRRRSEDADVEVAGQELLDLLVAAGLGQEALDVRMRSPEGAHQRRQHVMGCARGEPDPQSPGLPGPHAFGGRAQRVERAEQEPHGSQQCLASGRQPYLPPRAGEELDPHAGLELLNPLGERRLRDVQARRRPGEMTLLGEGRKGGQPVDHYVSPWAIDTTGLATPALSVLAGVARAGPARRAPAS